MNKALFVVFGILAYIGITSMIQGIKNDHLTQSQLFKKIPESVILDFNHDDKHYFNDLSIHHSSDGKKWVEVNRAERTGKKSFQIWPKTDTIPFGTVIELHYDKVNNNYILMNKDSFVYIIHIKGL